MPDLHVFATIRPRPDDRAAVVAALSAILGPTRAEDGCRRFELMSGIDGDDALYLVEAWADEAALTRHHTMPHTLAAAAAIDGKLLTGTQVIRMIPAG